MSWRATTPAFGGEYLPRIRIVLDIAGASGFDAPIRARRWHAMGGAEMGLGREDDAAVAKVYAEAAGITCRWQALASLPKAVFG